MTSCAEASAQVEQIRRNNVNYSSYRSVADYVVTVAHWQAHLNCSLGLYSGPADGIWGINSRRAVQTHMAHLDLYRGPEDGAWGINTWKAIQQWATNDGAYEGPIDGVPGPNTWSAIFGILVPVN